MAYDAVYDEVAPTAAGRAQAGVCIREMTRWHFNASTGSEEVVVMNRLTCSSLLSNSIERDIAFGEPDSSGSDETLRDIRPRTASGHSELIEGAC
ncbi:MAG: hypothetical protein ACRC20_04880 [Segniliparus sp.]|uniref:hypothetical protein n=1 Tax=Segniliparus sp. TaxID=2804064 RepID=UPI003F314728